MVETKKLETRGLTKCFGNRKVVDNLSLELQSGEVVGLLGPNGAGKTTTFYMIVGLYKPEAGSVYFNGEDITDYPMYLRARNGISYLPQEASVFRKLTVEENILAILQRFNLSKDEMKERLDELLKELGLSSLAKSKAYVLSGGERRRLEITRALVTSPLFLLFDEPFTGIDPIAVSDIQNIINQLREKGIGVLISDHNVRETLGVCDRAYIISQGKILEHGNAQTIVSSPRAREVYLGEKFNL
ncbi:MAG: LPS export ABC transporter ATP-binding protein [Deltaproteobacteria bacterium]|nr:LPS export ABC transporter ATP-binding protein [Deltaproteobacteria bacterium]